MSKRKIAIITGISLFLMAIIAGFSIGYAYSEFHQPAEIDFLKDKILNNLELYQAMLIGILIILILDLLVSYTLYKYFENDNKKLSMVSSAIRIIYTAIFGIAVLFLSKNLSSSEITNQIIASNYQNFQSIWSAGLMIFGVHIILIGVLMKLHQGIPKFLWYLTLFAGISYMLVHLLKLADFNSQFVRSLEMILAIPMALGELGLATWLLFKGGKVNNVKNETNR